jgi:hypothetical protein
MMRAIVENCGLSEEVHGEDARLKVLLTATDI